MPAIQPAGSQRYGVFDILRFTNYKYYGLIMYYLVYRAKKIDILKCSKCRGYPITLTLSDQPEPGNEKLTYEYTCEKCDASGSVRISKNINLEGFKTWEELQERIDELKAAMSLGGIDKIDMDYPNNE